ncbi:MAG: DMT family transporter [Acidimicrobiales bacterium]
MTNPAVASKTLTSVRAKAFPWPAAFFLLAAIWGCSFWWIKLGLRSFSPVDVAFGRLAVGGTALVAISGLTRARFPRQRTTWGHLFVLAILFNSVPFTLVAYGETHISAVLAGIINALTPLAALLVVLAVFREEPPSVGRIGGLALGFTGVLVVVGVWNGLGSGELLGVGSCLGAVTCYGIGFPYARHHLTDLPEGPVALATGQVLCGSLQLLPFAVLTGHVHDHVAAASVSAMLGLGVLGSGIAYILNFHVVSQAGGTTASTVTYLTPIFAVVVGSAFLGEPVTWYEPVGCLVILAGAALSQGRIPALPKRPRPLADD